VSGSDLDEAIRLCRSAAQLCPDEPKYAYTLAFYLSQKGLLGEAASVLEGVIEKEPSYPDAYMLLGPVYEKQGDVNKAKELYGRALRNIELSDAERAQLRIKIQSLRPRP